jgi:hypothetical protein
VIGSERELAGNVHTFIKTSATTLQKSGHFIREGKSYG